MLIKDTNAKPINDRSLEEKTEFISIDLEELSEYNITSGKKSSLNPLNIIQSTNEQINNLLDALPDLVLKIQINGAITYCNGNKKNLNLSQAELIGKNINEIFHPLTHLQFVEAIENANNSGLTQTFEFQQFELSELHEYEARIDTLNDKSEFIAIIRDISEQKRLELELKKNEKKFRILLESAVQGIVVVDLQGKITLVNNVCEKMFGYNRNELLNQPVEILIPESIRKEHQDKRNVFFSRPESRSMGNGLDLTGLRKDGSVFPIEVGLSSIEINEGTFVMASINDITQRKNLEIKLRQIEKLEAIGQLAGGIAHDFNNVLAGIIGLGELALRKIQRSESPEENIHLIIEKAYDAANLVRQLLTFSRKQSVNLHPVNLNTILNHDIKLLHRYLGEQIEIQTDVRSDLYSIEADESAIGQIITNLCINARDAMPNGGEIHLKAENINIDSEMFSDMGTIPIGNYVKLSVIDQGVGMTQEVKKRIFDPFYTTKDIGEGTGLGLSIVYALVKQLHSWMICNSRPEQGTQFEIFFPQLNPQDQVKSNIKSTNLPKGHETVLLVENEADLITTYKSSLETAGFKVLVASNGLKALDVLKQNSSSIDLIISDVLMPKMGGAELQSVTSQDYPDLKFLFISAYPDKLEPGSYILRKPFRYEKLITTVREILDKK